MFELDKKRDAESPAKTHTSHIAPALGTFWAHSVNTRLELEKNDHSNSRKITIAKSPSAPVASFYYQIGNGGLHLDDDRNKQGGQNFWIQNQ